MVNIKEDKYAIERKPAYSKPAVKVSEVRSVEGRTRKVLDMKYQDSDCVQRLVSVGCDGDDNIIEKHVTFKCPWDMRRLCLEYDNDSEISFKWLESERCEKNLTFFGSYHIGTCMTVQMENARTVKPFLVGSTLQEEMEQDIRVEELDERTCVVHDGFSKAQPTSTTLKSIMESEIQEMVVGYRGESAVVDAQDGLPADKDEDEKEEQVCPSCLVSPCVWASNENTMVAWDNSENGHLGTEDLPSNSTRRKCLYRQMALTISEGPLGKGNRIHIPTCARDGIRALFPDEKGNYMGHKDK